MIEFYMSILAGIVTAIIIAAVTKWLWPSLQDKCLYKGIRVAGAWEISEVRNGKTVKAGKIHLKQKGRVITGSSTRTKTRDGKKSERHFKYHGFTCGKQITLTFEDSKGVGFDTGTYVFMVQNDGTTMLGMATFHGKTENKIVSEPRTLTKVVA
jgi:hypothetical protein